MTRPYPILFCKYILAAVAHQFTVDIITPMPDLRQGHLHHIPAGRPFADDLAQGILAMVTDPQDMSDSIILLPNRRLSTSLRTSFLRIAEGKSQLLPRMMPIGDIDEDAAELIAAGWDADDKPPIIDGLDRQLILSRLVRQFLVGTDLAVLSDAEVIALARALGQFLDQMQTAGCDPAQLDGLTEGDHAGHWQRILNFLKIVTQSWPEVLAEKSLSDPVIWRNAAIEARAEAWRKNPPKGLVIVAGSTGSVASTQSLMKAVLTLPRGHLVLPGLDMDMPEDDWRVLSSDQEKALSEEQTGHPSEASSEGFFDAGLVAHPQYPLAHLLEVLGVARAEIGLWPGVEISSDRYDPRATGRLALLREAMRPAQQSGQWRLIPERQDVKPSSLNGLMRVDCYDRRQEAEVIALAMREVLETPGKTAMLISGDQRLSQMVSGELKRWGVMVSSSAGQKLSETSPAQFMQLIIEAWQSDFAVVPLLAMARHRLASAGLEKSVFRQELRTLERLVLRGPKIEGGLKEIAAKAHDESKSLGQFVERHLIKPMMPLMALDGRINLTLADFADAHGSAAELLAAHPDADTLQPWQGQDGTRLAKFMHKLGLHGQTTPLEAHAYAPVLQVLMAGEVIYPDHIDHPRLSILGTVEARMQAADLTILGGMNEGISPPETPADPWMSNTMRVDFGLPHAHWRIGHAAHDAVMAMARPEVLITQAGRDQGAPTQVSRWLRRIDAVLDVAQLSWPDSNRFIDLADALTPKALAVKPCLRPEPKPKLDLRPTQFSATGLDTLLRDPYAIYARRILNLKALPELEEGLGAADRGTIIHDALADFIDSHPQPLGVDDAFDALIKAGQTAFAPYKDNPSVMAFWWPRFEEIARFIAEQERIRTEFNAKSHAEIDGQITLSAAGVDHIITARADRIDCGANNDAYIIDYKTGTAPAKKAVEGGRALQMLVEALILADGGFAPITAERDDVFQQIRLSYWKLTGKRNAAGQVAQVTPKDDEYIDQTRQGLTDLLAAFQNPDQGYRAEPVANEANPYSDYRHLARVAEWSIMTDDGDDGA